MTACGDVAGCQHPRSIGRLAHQGRYRKPITLWDHPLDHVAKQPQHGQGCHAYEHQVSFQSSVWHRSRPSPQRRLIPEYREKKRSRSILTLSSVFPPCSLVPFNAGRLFHMRLRAITHNHAPCNWLGLGMSNAYRPCQAPSRRFLRNDSPRQHIRPARRIRCAQTATHNPPVVMTPETRGVTRAKSRSCATQ